MIYVINHFDNNKSNSAISEILIDIVFIYFTDFLLLDEGEVRESFTLADASQHKIDQAIPDHVVFYEPDTKVTFIDSFTDTLDRMID